LKSESHSLIFKLLFYTSNIFHLQIYLRIQVKSEILTTQTNICIIVEIRISNLKSIIVEIRISNLKSIIVEIRISNLKSHSFIDFQIIILYFKLLFYTSNIFHLQIYLRTQVKSEILTTQTNQVVSFFEIQITNSKSHSLIKTQITNSKSHSLIKTQITNSKSHFLIVSNNQNLK